MVSPLGIEPRTFSLQERCATNCAKETKMVLAGVEPATFACLCIDVSISTTL